MDVLSVITVIFVENLTAILGLAGFIFLAREFRRRKQRFLLAFALIFACIFIGNLALYVGQVLHVYGFMAAAALLVRSRQIVIIMEAGLFFWVLIELYGGKYKWFWIIFAPAFPLLSLYVFLTNPFRIVDIYGLAFQGVDSIRFAGIFGAWLVVNFILITLPKLRSAADAKDRVLARSPERFLLAAGLSGVFFFATVFVRLLTGIEAFYFLAQIFYVGHIVFLFFGAGAVEHPDPLLRERPTAVFTRSMVIKAAALTALLFWLLAFALLALTSRYFVAVSVETRKEGLRRDVHFFSRSYAGYGSLFLEETLHLADEARISDVAKGATTELPPDVHDYVQRGQGKRILRIVDAAGKIVYSSFSPDEIGTDMSSSPVIKKALGGKPVAATEHEDAGDFWSIRAAVPLILADGSSGGVVLGTDARPAFDFSDYTTITQVTASGYGFITERGQQVFTWGEEVDELAKMAFRKVLSGSAITSSETNDGTFFAVERVRATDGAPDGWFYVFMTHKAVEEQILRILSLVAFLMVLALAAITTILIFSVALVLKPIQELRKAARHIEEGQYDVRVSYDSPDELGDLAIAFNQMGETIGERTRSLHAALEEERDFLMHTAMEMRSPLNVFRWTIEMMRFGDTGRLTKEQLELLEQMHQTTRRLIGFSQNLLDASLLEQGKISLKKDSVQVEDVIDEVAGEYSIRLREKDINLHWNHPAKPLPKLVGDRDRLKQILMNVIGNAAKYTKENGHVEIAVTESSVAGPGARHGRFLKFSIEDNGRGIPKTEQGRVFTPFYRGSNVVKEDIQGIGLGLFITKELVELHGGKMWFKSEADAGATFNFTIPIERVVRKAEPRGGGGSGDEKAQDKTST